MLHFGLVAPVGGAAVASLSLILFTMLIFMVPGTLLYIVLSRAGIRRKKGKTTIEWPVLLNRVAGFVLYHLFMLVIWVITWPQMTNSVHSGYSLVGVGYILLVMVFWTATGMLAIYAWHLLQNAKARMPGLGFFLRLYIWNIVAMLIFRQIIYWVLTGGTPL